MEQAEFIVDQVRAALEHGAHIDLARHPVEIELRGGIVTLNGEVPGIASKKLARSAAGGVAGVQGVVDRLCVATSQAFGDGAIRDAVCKWLARDVDFHNCTMRMRNKGQLELLHDAGDDARGDMVIEVENGVVTLSGQVISLSHKRLAGALAWWARGCRDVANELVVEPAEEDNDEEVIDALRLVLETDPYVHADAIRIVCRDLTVTLEGAVASESELRQAELDAWYIDGVKRVINRLEVRH